MPLEERFNDPGAMADALAAHLTAILGAAMTARGQASLIVSGGKTPRALFERLCEAALDWRGVLIGLADERWVAAEDASSNERLVRDHLLKRAASAARFLALKNAAPTPDQGAEAAWNAYRAIPRPFDAVLLGMGEDGHTASLFPGTSALAAALDPNTAPGCVAMTAPVAPFARLSLNLSALLQTRQIVIAANGEGKWSVYERALAAGPSLEMPVRAILRQQSIPVTLFWSP